MSASREWEEKHLTPRGWVQGSCRHDGRSDVQPMPPDAVLTVRKTVAIGTAYGAGTTNVTRTPRGGDAKVRERLLAQYGQPTFGV